MYIIRLDDASEYHNKENWGRIEKMLDSYNIKPIVGIIPQNKDMSIIEKYKKDESFWLKAKEWQSKGWIISMHGYEHLYVTSNGGINPIQKRSEFAGLSEEEQCKKIREGYNFLCEKEIKPLIFFAPSHTFDKKTINALKKETPIRIISDTIANDTYFDNDIYYIPVQSGKVRKLPFKTCTFCYHPNEMNENDFLILEQFIKTNINKFTNLNLKKLKKRKKSIYDILLNKIYFLRRKK